MSDQKSSKPAVPSKPSAKPSPYKVGKTPVEVVAFAAMTVVWFFVVQTAIVKLSPYFTMAGFAAIVAFFGTLFVARRGAYWEPPFPEHHTPDWFVVRKPLVLAAQEPQEPAVDGTDRSSADTSVFHELLLPMWWII